MRAQGARPRALSFLFNPVFLYKLTDKNILVTLITVKPVKQNARTDTVSSFVTLQDLLV